MPYRARTSCFIFSKLINIVLGPILSPQLELSLFHSKTAKEFASLAFYMNYIFGAFKIYQEQYIILYDHFFPCMIWSRLKFMLSKLKIGMTKIFALGDEYEIGRKIRLKPDKIEKILAWPVLQDQTAIRAFFSTIQSTRHWVLDFTELTGLLTRFTEKVEWK